MEEQVEKIKPGIKNIAFVSGEKNGKSHRQNKAKKHARYLKNREARAQLNMERARITPTEYHGRLLAISKGLA